MNNHKKNAYDDRQNEAYQSSAHMHESKNVVSMPAIPTISRTDLKETYKHYLVFQDGVVWQGKDVRSARTMFGLMLALSAVVTILSIWFCFSFIFFIGGFAYLLLVIPILVLWWTFNAVQNSYQQWQARRMYGRATLRFSKRTYSVDDIIDVAYERTIPLAQGLPKPIEAYFRLTALELITRTVGTVIEREQIVKWTSDVKVISGFKSNEELRGTMTFPLPKGAAASKQWQRNNTNTQLVWVLEFYETIEHITEHLCIPIEVVNNEDVVK